MQHYAAHLHATSKAPWFGWVCVWWWVYACLSHGVVGRVWQQAAECIAASESRRLGVAVTTKDFKKKGTAVRPRTYSMQRFQLLLPIFEKGLPADLCAAVEHADS
jgi:hypothetical protein